MRLSYVQDDPEVLLDTEQDNRMTVVSGYMAGLAYNQLCQMIGGRFPDCKIEEEAPLAHEFFMKLFGVIQNE